MILSIVSASAAADEWLFMVPEEVMISLYKLQDKGRIQSVLSHSKCFSSAALMPLDGELAVRL